MENREPVEQIIFLHIPKTAGTNLDKIAMVMSNSGTNFHYQRMRVPRVAGRSPNLITADWIGGLKEIEQHPELPNHIPSPFFLTGHFPYGLHRYFSNPSKYITLVRHPIERELSDANFSYQRGYISEEDFNSYNLEEMIDNPQVRFIAGREYMTIPCNEETFEQAKENIERDFLLVAPSEEIDLFIQMIASLQGWDSCAYAPMQITKQKVVEMANPELTRKLLQKHQWDLKLYEWVQGRFQQWKEETSLIPRTLSVETPIATLMPDFLTTRKATFLTISEIEAYNQTHEESDYIELK